METVEIKDFKDCNTALEEIKNWLRAGVFNRKAYSEIEETIEAVEDYMGIPLPAKGFIQSNCSSN